MSCCAVVTGDLETRKPLISASKKMIRMPSIYLIRPENPRKAIDISPNVIRVMEGPFKGAGTSAISSRVLIAVSKVSMSVKPIAVPRPKMNE